MFGLMKKTVFVAGLFAVVVSSATAQRVTEPREHFGFNIGDDYHLATYDQFVSYWQRLAEESPRMIVEEIGRTAEDRPQLMAVITSPENHAQLDRYQEIARRLALAEDISEEDARALAAEGKSVVWIDGGLHATEVLGAHQLIEFVYQMVSRNDSETLRFLDDIVILAVHANPDGMELVSNWYMRNPVAEQRNSSGIPRLYQKYVGHDNNRDFYMSAQPETENMNRVMYREWFPQIVYNHHQTGPAGTVMFAPPFRDPFNYNFDPLIPLSIEMVGAAMHSRFVAEGKPGTTMRSGASYSTWWNGGLRTTPYFHNMIGLLTETIGNPTPVEIPFVLNRQLPQNDIAAPIAPQVWHFRQSIDYSQTANRAVLDYASRYREVLLYNIFRMGRNAIDRGNSDTWTVHPRKLNEIAEAAADDPQYANRGNVRNQRLSENYAEMLRAPEDRDPRGYILPANQADFPTATKFVNTLIKNGVAVHQAARDFEVNGKSYPQGSYVVLTAQAFGPHVLDMFEPQDHPDDFEYPGGPPIAPYDNTGWTLAFQMGVEFDRILDGFTGPFEEIEGFASTPSGMFSEGAAGFLMDHAVNDVFVATNRILASGGAVRWLTESVEVNGRTWPAGTVYVPNQGNSSDVLRTASQELGLEVVGIDAVPGTSALNIRPVRIGLWDRYGGSMPSGWARWLLEQFEFPFEVVFPQELDAGNLNDKFDVLIFVSGAIPTSDRGSSSDFGGPPSGGDIPAQYQHMLGSVSVQNTVPRIKEFVEAGGTVITIGSSAALAQHFGLPVTDYKVNAQGGTLTRDDHFVPGSILRIAVDNTQPVAYGLQEHVDVHFNHSPVFGVSGDGAAVNRVAWFDTDKPLRSGWAWGQEVLEGGTTILDAQVGQGRLFVFGPEVIRRGQPHGSFKFFFNGIYLGKAETASAGMD